MKNKSVFILIVVFLITIFLGYVTFLGFGKGHILSARNIEQGLDLSGGVYIVYEASKDEPTQEEMDAAISMIQNRLDRKGFTEAQTLQEGTKRIRVEIPGVSDAETAVNEIGQTAKLVFMNEEGQVVVDGSNVIDAKKMAYTDNANVQKIVVSLEFDEKGTKDFKNATEQNIGKRILIVLDNNIISAPTVNVAITDGKAVIEGGFDAKSADELASLIRAGSLPFDLNILETNTVGATLGANALKTSIYGGIVGISLVLLFMLIFYRLSGLAANWALFIYIFLELIILNGLNITLTLPGIAGIILSVGMAVDANVIIFERIKEEINLGRTVRLAVANGFSRAFPAILDSNITTLIAGFILYWLGSGTIKGFAQTLIIGILLSMFTSLFVTKIIIKSLIASGARNPKLYYGK